MNNTIKNIVDDSASMITKNPIRPVAPESFSVLAEKTCGFVSVGGIDSDIDGFDSYAIQMAVDLLKARNGGIVRLEKGTYEISAPIRLCNNVTLTGAGEQTVLHKVDGYKSQIVYDADLGEIMATVEDASGFSNGMGIMVYDSEHIDEWLASTAVITSIDKNRIDFDKYLVRDYKEDKFGFVSNTCSIIEGVEIHDAKVCDLVIDGNADNNERINGCIGGGIYFHKAKNCIVENVKILNFNGDGISWQIDTDIAIRKCDVAGCTGFGLHPGTGSLNTVVDGCDIHDNGSDGIFLCSRVQKGQFKNNKIHNNGGCGINAGHKDTDNLFEINNIYENAFCGVYMRNDKPSNGPHRNVYRKNTIENNGAGKKGYGILIDSYVEKIKIEENVIRDTGKNVQRVGIMINRETSDLKISDNDFSGNLDGEIVKAACPIN